MAPSPIFFSKLDHLSVALELAWLHPALEEEKLRYSESRPEFGDWPFLESGAADFALVRPSKGIDVEGMRFAVIRGGAAFYSPSAVNELAEVVAMARYQCIFERLKPEKFRVGLPVLASAFRNIARSRRFAIGRSVRTEAIFVVDEISPGSTRFKVTVLVCTLVGSALTGSATFLAQYPAIKAGAVELLKDAGFIARELEPVEREVCEMEYDA